MREVLVRVSPNAFISIQKRLLCSLHQSASSASSSHVDPGWSSVAFVSPVVAAVASGSVASSHLCDVFSSEGVGRFLELEDGDEEDHDEFDDGG